MNLVTKNNNTEHTEGGHASDLIRKNCFFSSEEFKFNNFAIDNLDFWQQSALNFKVFKSIKLQSSSSSSPVRNSDSFLANLLILFVKILILFYHSECVRRVGLNKKIGWLPSCPLTLWDYRWPGLGSVGNESIWMVIEKSESIASEMKAQAIAEILAISATSRPINYFGFFGPFDTFLGSDIPDLTPPPLWVKNCSSKVSIFVFMFCEWLTPVRMRDHDCDLKSDQNDTDIDTGTLTPIPIPVKINS